MIAPNSTLYVFINWFVVVYNLSRDKLADDFYIIFIILDAIFYTSAVKIIRTQYKIQVLVVEINAIRFAYWLATEVMFRISLCNVEAHYLYLDQHNRSVDYSSAIACPQLCLKG